MTRSRWLLAGLLLLLAYLALWPVPVEPSRWNAPQDSGYTEPFTVNNRLAHAQLRSLEGLSGPEDVSFGFGGRVFATTHEGKLLVFDGGLDGFEVFAELGGRPLGIEFDGQSLYVANAYLGIQKIAQDGSVTVLIDEFEGKAIEYANELAVDSQGTIYFSDASSKFGARAWAGTYSASLLDIMEHGGHGRVFRFDQATGTLELLMKGLNFANGVALSPDERYLLVSETGAYRIWKHWLAGANAGNSEIVIDNLPGFPDNINNTHDGHYWIGLVAPRNALLDRLSGYPRLRKAVQRLPAFVRPRAQPSSHLIAIDGDGRAVTNLMDTAAAYPAITGAIDDGNCIYVASLFAPNIARLCHAPQR